MGHDLSRIERREDDFLVGREGELERYRRYLDGEAPNGRNVWCLYGTGGVGKSTLLDAFRRMSVQRGAAFLYMDSRDFHHSPEEWAEGLLRQCSRWLPAGTGEGEAREGWAGEAGAEPLLAALEAISRTRPVTLAFDTYEEMDDLDPWIRESLVQWLPDRCLVLLASRVPPKGKWKLSPAWRERVERIPLGPLDREEILSYLARCGISSPEAQEKIRRQSRGHPLALTLLASAALDEEDGEEERESGWFESLAERWLREAPDPKLRELVEVASIVRQFDCEALERIGGEAVDPADFDRLCGLSFVRKSARGWALHDLMRDATSKRLRERQPSRCRLLLERSVHDYRSRIAEAPRDGSAAWEMAELFSYIGSATLRWMVAPSSAGEYYWEPLTPGNLAEGESYAENRIAGARPYSRIGPDSAGGIRRAERELDRETDIGKLRGLDLRSCLDIGGGAAKLLRNREGEVVGLSVVVPIRAETLPYLRKDPLASPYLRSLTPEQLEELKGTPHRPAGWFIRLIDIADSEDPSLAMEALFLIFSYMVSDGILIASPPPHPAYARAHLDMGFEVVPGVVHRWYDGVTPTPTFRLDTRGERLGVLLDTLLERTGMKGAGSGASSGASSGTTSTGSTSPGTTSPGTTSAGSASSGTGASSSTGGSPSGSADGSSAAKTEAPPGRGVPGEEDERLSVLTEREREIALLVLQGLTNIEIGSRLFLSEITVKKHLSSVYEKLRVRNRVELLRLLLAKP
ncbi:helix-turn-helix transcriptional regulator [Cohnella xylanilytica]|nr:LuxR family transcriptional regulator [Cohnella xylanilytica]